MSNGFTKSATPRNLGSRRAAVLAILLVVAVLGGCEDAVVIPPGPSPWVLKPDSMNLGILILDFLSYEFEGGRLDYFPPCDSCDVDSLPFEQIYNPPVDLGDITFRYTETGDTLLYATTIWGGSGRIVYPSEFLATERFIRTWPPLRPPVRMEYFFNDARTTRFARADTAWQHAKTLDVVREFSSAEYRVGVYLHGARSADPDPTLNSWVIFLYRSGSPTGTQ
ncbi:MAG: hypothetical protein ACE5EO_13120 [Candidatus Krumholzibacteriia bacterium]